MTNSAKLALQRAGILSKDEVEQKRIALCTICPERRIKMDIEYCGKCGCILPLKRMIFAAKCPLGHW